MFRTARRRPPASPNRSLRVVAVAVGVVAGPALLAACSSGSTLDTARVETSIGADLTKAGLGGTVHCPPSRPVSAGDAFTCTVDLAGGGSLSYDVTQTSAAGEVSYQLAPGQLVTGTVVADELTRRVADEARTTVTVTCPPSALTPGGTGTMDCTMATDATQLDVSVTLAGGHVTGWDRRG